MPDIILEEQIAQRVKKVQYRFHKNIMSLSVSWDFFKKWTLKKHFKLKK